MRRAAAAEERARIAEEAFARAQRSERIRRRLDPDVIETIPKPKGEAGAGERGFNLQWEMGLAGEGSALFADIQVGRSLISDREKNLPCLPALRSQEYYSCRDRPLSLV